MKNWLFKVLSVNSEKKYTFIFKIHTFIDIMYILICTIYT